jgi:gamma-glutamyltranspeptidase/glutathione hydrolase
VRLPDLARSYRDVAERGIGWFYGGPLSVAVDRWMRAEGGLVRSNDFQSYQIREREPVRTTYRGYDIVGFPPPSSGGVHVAQILSILENLDLKSMGPDSADFVHAVTEAMKLAFADRAYWLGDPDFAPVPRGLVSREYGARLARRIRMDRASAVAGHGTPPNAAGDLFGKHTTHFNVADAAGNWVACTATLNTSFGSKVVVPGTGIVWNNQMDDFSAQPGVANYFGLIGAEANAVAPGKRPLSSMSPTLVLSEGRPVLAVGAAGGPTIISQTLLTILRVIEFGQTPEEALRAPRFHHQWKPDVLRLEKSWPESVRGELKARGHQLVVEGELGACQAVAPARGGTGLDGASDPRLQGLAAGF